MTIDGIIYYSDKKKKYLDTYGTISIDSDAGKTYLTIDSNYELDDKLFNSNDVHIHFLEGGIKKDGPSAGVTMTTALVSALTNEPVRNDVAMTGEITLRGRVLAIGGLREKTMAAYLAGVKTILIPKDNEKDIAELADEVKENVTIIPVKRAEEVLSVILERNPFDKE